ncbi:MAG: single-stranded DNA-binding protein [Candidatus Pacebacteria bacterium]|nr:single-stranded DNA-binding protein [Candidatus Paceibacterota bacterium]
MYINKVTILGNLTRDPEMKSLPTGLKVVTFSLATNRSWKDQQGMKKDSVEYHNVVAFGKPAEIINQYSKKGSSLYVEGRLQTRSWDDASGVKKYRTEIVLENFQFGPKAQGTGSYQEGSQSTPANQSTPESKNDFDQSGSSNQMDQIDTIEYPTEDFENINIEDIPF